MTNLLGIALFALGIGLTIALHEAGHMLTARAFGMRVRRYYIGFGPKVASFRRGHTEYGLAALPLGGFCDIAGMTGEDPLTPEEEPLAMYKRPWWQRVIVLSGGVIVNLLLGLIILYFIAVSSGIPDPTADTRPRVGELSCSADQRADGELEKCSGPGAGERAGIAADDVIVAVDGEEVKSFADVRDYVLVRPGEEVIFTVERGGEVKDVAVTPDVVKRLNAQGELVDAGAVGLANKPLNIVRTYGPLEAAPAVVHLSVQLLDATIDGIAQFPAKIPGVVASIFGAERDEESPMSVVGASRVGGELVERSLWSSFFMLLVSLNYFLALFNLIPLPPFDGGHIAVVFYEKIRDALRRMRGIQPGGPADYSGLMPVTYAVAALLMTVGAITIVADVVNPIRLFG